MIDVSFSITARLIERLPGRFAFIGTVADIGAASDVKRLSVPALYVGVPQEVADPGEAIGASVQTHTARVVLLFLGRYAGDATGTRAAQALQPLRDAVHAVLVGWTPPGCHSPLAFAAGELDPDEIDGGMFAWRDELTTQRRIQRPRLTT